MKFEVASLRAVKPQRTGVQPGRRGASHPARVLICPDKFKGTLTAPAAAEAIATGWRQARPDDVLDLLPISDGGDGFGELLGQHLGAEARACETVDAAHRPIETTWWWLPESRTAIVESARVIGLAMLPPGQFHPFDLDTFGLGSVLRDIREANPSSTLVGIGGSATNDAGFGVARALGWRFLDATGTELKRWPDLVRLERIVGFAMARLPLKLTIAVDVDNPLLGPSGATRIYGPQKGLRASDLQPAERALRRLAEVFGRQGRNRAGSECQAGAGAAGGLGFGLGAFLGGKLEPGFDLFARATCFSQRLHAVDLVLTGEGAIDTTTVRMGKGVGRVARLCRQARKPCLGLAGVVNLDGHQISPFTSVTAMAPGLTTVAKARSNAARWLAALARQTAAAWAGG